MSFYEYGEIDQYSWWIRDIFRNYCYCLEGNGQAVLIDTGIGLPGLDILVKELVHVPVNVILTHGHLDHIGGSGLWEKVWIYQADDEIRKKHQSSKYRRIIEDLSGEIGVKLSKEHLESCIFIREPQKVFFLEEGIFEFGGRELEVIHTPGHTAGSICLLERKTQRLFTGDTVCEKRVMLSFSESLSPEIYKKSLNKLLKCYGDICEIYSGHNRNPIEKTYLNQYEQCADTVEKNLEELSIYFETSVFGKCMVCKKDSVELTVPIRKENEKKNEKSNFV